MLKIREAIVVEGRYDKIALENAVDTVIFTTEGFGIFRDAEKAELLRRVAEKRGLIVLTDSDGAGLVIRNRLRGCIAPEYLKHAYIPELPGKERRKTKASREGTLGVEGMPLSVLEDVLRRAGATETEGESALPLTKTDVFSLGLSGTADAAARREALQKELGLPRKMSANALLDALNSLYTREELSAALHKLEEQGTDVSR